MAWLLVHFSKMEKCFSKKECFSESLCSIDPTSGKIESVSEFPSSFRPIQATIDPTGKLW